MLVVFTLAFGGLLLKSAIKFHSNPIGTKISVQEQQNLAFPTFYICPWQYAPGIKVLNVGMNITQEDLDELPPVHDFVQVFYDFFVPYHNPKYVPQVVLTGNS